MEPIFPLHEERINMFCGMPVCIVTKEGMRHIGILSHCKSGRLTLNADAAPKSAAESVVETASESPAATKKKKKTVKKSSVETTEKAQTQAYPYDPYYPYYRPYNPFGEYFAIDLALVAFLFLLI